MTDGLINQVVIVTGSGRGFGRAIAKRFAAEGAKVVVTSRTGAQLDETVDQIHRAGGEAFAVQGDVTQREDVTRVVETAEDHFGPVSLLVNNAGNSGQFAPLWVVDPDKWWNGLAVHLRGLLLYSRAVLPGMVERKSGRIIAVSSLASTRILPNMSCYAVAKSAQVRLIAHIAAEGKDHGITSFAIEPGTVHTDLAKADIENPDAKRWVPWFVDHLKQIKEETDTAEGLARCAELCFNLASGRCDALTGQYMDVRDDLEKKLREAGSGE